MGRGSEIDWTTWSAEDDIRPRLLDGFLPLVRWILDSEWFEDPADCALVVPCRLFSEAEEDEEIETTLDKTPV